MKDNSTPEYYQWVNASERLPDSDSNYPLKTTGNFLYVGWYDKENNEWYADHDQSFSSTHVEWLEKLPPLREVVSAEEVGVLARDKAQEHFFVIQNQDGVCNPVRYESFKDGFIAGNNASLPHTTAQEHDREVASKAWDECEKWKGWVTQSELELKKIEFINSL